MIDLRQRRARGVERGFAFLELMFGAVIAAILIAGLYSFYRSQLYAIRTEEVAIDVKEEADAGIDLLVRELRLAGARPEPYGCGGTPPSGCSNFLRLVQARTNRIELQYDYRGNTAGSLPDGCPDDPNERIIYNYDTALKAITRQEPGQAAFSVIGNLPAATAFTLTYFDENGATLSPGVNGLNQADRARISTIEIRVAPRVEHPAPWDQSVIQLARTARVFLRNKPC